MRKYYINIINKLKKTIVFNRMASTSELTHPGIGVAVFVTSLKHIGHILIGKRGNKLKTGPGLFQLPGGHLEFGESWEDAAEREVYEETGLKIKNIEVCTAVNTVVLEKKYHYITVFLKGDIDETALCTEPENREPDKCEGWKWIKFKDMPPSDQLFYALKDFCSSGRNPFQMGPYP